VALVVVAKSTTSRGVVVHDLAQQQISDHVIHGSNISLGGLAVTGGANRNLLDYFQIALDRRAPRSSRSPTTQRLRRQRVRDAANERTSAYASANGTGQVAAVPPPAPVIPIRRRGGDGLLHDAVAGLLQPVLTDNALISCQSTTLRDRFVTSQLQITATMKVSSLVPVPAGVSGA